jgi:hypothetical protein
MGMQARTGLTLLLFLVAGAWRPHDGDGVFPGPGHDPVHSRLRWPDGHVSLNDTCMVRVANSLNASMPPAYVNGRPVGFC